MFAALMLVLLAGGMNGSFAVPMKYLRGWQWEHAGFCGRFWGCLSFPWRRGWLPYRISGLYTARLGRRRWHTPHSTECCGGRVRFSSAWVSHASDWLLASASSSEYHPWPGPSHH